MREEKKKTIAGHLCNLFRRNCYQNCCLQAICTALSVRNVWRFPLVQAQNAFGVSRTHMHFNINFLNYYDFFFSESSRIEIVACTLKMQDLNK